MHRGVRDVLFVGVIWGDRSYIEWSVICIGWSEIYVVVGVIWGDRSYIEWSVICIGWSEIYSVVGVK